MTHEYDWRYYSNVRCCHRWFTGIKTDGTTGIAVADESGKYPDETDDGVLWLDKSQPVVIKEPYEYDPDYSDHWITVKIALLDDAGNRKWLGGTNLVEAKELNRWFGVKLTGWTPTDGIVHDWTKDRRHQIINIYKVTKKRKRKIIRFPSPLSKEWEAISE